MDTDPELKFSKANEMFTRHLEGQRPGVCPNIDPQKSSRPQGKRTKDIRYGLSLLGHSASCMSQSECVPYFLC